MPILPLWPNRAIKPPYGAAEINRAHPLAQGLCWAVLGNSWPPVEIVQGVIGVPAGNAVLGSNGWGSGIALDGTGDYVEFAQATDLWGGGVVSVCGLFTYILVGGHYHTIVSRGQWSIYCYDSNIPPMLMASVDAPTPYSGSLVSGSAYGGPSIPLGFGMTYDAVNIRGSGLRPPGAIGVATVATPEGVLNASSNAIRIGMSPTGTNALKGVVNVVYAWNRVLAWSEMAAALTDPYCFLLSRVPRTYGFVGAGAPPPTGGQFLQMGKYW